VACTKTIKTLQATGGSRADGVVELSYGVGAFENPEILWDKAIEIATEACQGWGYEIAKPFGGSSSDCQVQGDFGSGCVYFLITYKYQCISPRANVKDKVINISSGSCFEKPSDVDDCQVMAEQGLALAQGMLGLLYYSGQGVTQDYKEAVKWSTKSAEQGLALAQLSLGEMYLKGHGVQQDYKEAIKWFKKSAEQGDAEAQNNLGMAFLVGKGTLQDYKVSVEWFKKSAEQGFSEAQLNLGLMYGVGRGILQDYKESVKWLTRAAEQGRAKAQYVLGGSYENGQGVLQDNAMAHMYWNIAAVSGHKGAIRHRSRIEKKMAPSQIEEAQELAREWMRTH